ncbi:hypothetical protein C8R46DRAFT_1231320 [Mycena filopes]|nr:hypothetical protein C8R46DRAFT_1231320 [Mycena filopes]
MSSRCSASIRAGPRVSVSSAGLSSAGDQMVPAPSAAPCVSARPTVPGPSARRLTESSASFDRIVSLLQLGPPVCDAQTVPTAISFPCPQSPVQVLCVTALSHIVRLEGLPTAARLTESGTALLYARPDGPQCSIPNSTPMSPRPKCSASLHDHTSFDRIVSLLQLGPSVVPYWSPPQALCTQHLRHCTITAFADVVRARRGPATENPFCCSDSPAPMSPVDVVNGRARASFLAHSSRPKRSAPPHDYRSFDRSDCSSDPLPRPKRFAQPHTRHSTARWDLCRRGARSSRSNDGEPILLFRLPGTDEPPIRGRGQWPRANEGVCFCPLHRSRREQEREGQERAMRGDESVRAKPCDEDDLRSHRSNVCARVAETAAPL